VPFDRARADEQLGTDLRITVPVNGQPGDLGLLGGELVHRLDRAPAYHFTGRHQLPPGAFSEGRHSHPVQQLMSQTQLLPGVAAAALPT